MVLGGRVCSEGWERKDRGCSRKDTSRHCGLVKTESRLRQQGICMPTSSVVRVLLGGAQVGKGGCRHSERDGGGLRPRRPQGCRLGRGPTPPWLGKEVAPTGTMLT